MRCRPPTDQLRRLLTEEVSGAEYAALEAHIEAWPACQAVLELLDATAWAADRLAPYRLPDVEPDLAPRLLVHLKRSPPPRGVPSRQGGWFARLPLQRALEELDE